jgi:WhiB family redox-sensing transcriptional regulator
VVDVMDVPIFEVPQPGRWARLGRCRTAPVSLFFPTQGDDVRQAKALCRGCPVLTECGTFALTYPSLQGVWAAMSEQERERMHQRAAS